MNCGKCLNPACNLQAIPNSVYCPNCEYTLQPRKSKPMYVIDLKQAYLKYHSKEEVKARARAAFERHIWPLLVEAAKNGKREIEVWNNKPELLKIAQDAIENGVIPAGLLAVRGAINVEFSFTVE